jgi:ketosteroid isomerase-like protein
MAQENIDFIRNLIEGSAAMDQQALVAALPELIPQIADPAIEWIEDPTRADSHIYHGHAGVLASWTQWLSQWDDYGWEIEALVDCGDDVFVAAREHASGHASGARVSSDIYLVITVRDLKITRWREFYDKTAALRAAGLEQQSARISTRRTAREDDRG